MTFFTEFGKLNPKLQKITDSQSIPKQKDYYWRYHKSDLKLYYGAVVTKTDPQTNI